MDRRLAILVLILAHSAPSLCRKLPNKHNDHVDHVEPHAEHHEKHNDHAVDHVEPHAEYHAEHSADDTVHEELDEAETPEAAERYGYIPTPNIASPILSTLLLPTTYPQHSINKESPIINVVPRDDWPSKRRRKIRIHDDGKLWTKIPKMKHIVEIVPIKHKSNNKGKALAYIVPKSHSVKKKLKKQKRISGIMLDRNVDDLSQVFESSEENTANESSESKSSDSDSGSTESSSTEQEDHVIKDDNGYDTEFRKATKVSIPHEDTDSTSEDTINDKLNDIVSYFKLHKDKDLNSLIHDVLPDEKADPEYHVHYIIHKKRRPNNNPKIKQGLNLNHNNNKIINVNSKKEDDSSEYDKKIHVYPSEDHDTPNKKEIQHVYENSKDKPESLEEKLNHLLHESDKHQQDISHSNHEPKHDITHSSHVADIRLHENQNGQVALDDNEYINPHIESIERLLDLSHESDKDPALEEELNYPWHESDVNHVKHYHDTSHSNHNPKHINAHLPHVVDTELNHIHNGQVPLDDNNYISPHIESIERLPDVNNDSKNDPDFEEILNHSWHESNVHHVKPHHDISHSDHEPKHVIAHLSHELDIEPELAHDEQANEDDNNDTNIHTKSSEQLPDLNHESEIDPDMDQIYEILEEIQNDPNLHIQLDHEDPSQTHHIHVNNDNESDNDDQPDNVDNDWDVYSSENYSDSNESNNDESQYVANDKDSKEQDLVEDSMDHSSEPDLSNYDDVEYSEESPENENDNQDSIVSTENVLPNDIKITPDHIVHGHGIIDTISQESPSSESIESLSSQHADNEAEWTLKDLADHDYIFPNCLKLKKKKTVKKCDNNCDTQKSYTLTFLFNK